MPWKCEAASDIGAREEQQDRFLVEHCADGNKHLLVVADGAGGHDFGALAAQVAVDCVKAHVADAWSTKEPEIFLDELIHECNRRVMAVGGSDDLAGCTTLVIVYLNGDEVFWGHAGDSRFYLLRDAEVVVKTVDHSLLELQRQQQASDTANAASPTSNKLYMCLGALADITPEIGSSVAREGDTLVLCSDGLWGQINMADFFTELARESPSAELLSKWSERAVRAYPRESDNITVIVAKLEAQTASALNPMAAISRWFR
jgi:serine/threonine protein phosphatase PrpC